MFTASPDGRSMKSWATVASASNVILDLYQGFYGGNPQASGFIKVVRARKGPYGASHAATDTGELACGNKPHADATVIDVSSELKDVT